MANGLEWVFVLLGGWTLLCQFENGNDFWKDAIVLVRTEILERQHLSEFRSITAILGTIRTKIDHLCQHQNKGFVAKLIRMRIILIPPYIFKPH